MQRILTMSEPSIAMAQRAWSERAEEEGRATLSGITLPAFFGPEEVDPETLDEKPGAHPYTRGIYEKYVPGQALDDAPIRRFRQRKGE